MGREWSSQPFLDCHSKQLGDQRNLTSPISFCHALQRWLAAETFPEAKKRRKRQSSFDAFAPYVLKRWQEGERNGLALWREIKAQGYTGTANGVYRRLETLKQAEVRASVNPERLQKYAANTAIWLFVRDPQKLDEIEREDLAAFCQASAPLKTAYDLLQDFLSMVHKREGHRLDAWLARVAESGLPELQSFATGVEKDKDAVQAGLTWPINNGMVEGHVTKLKLDPREQCMAELALPCSANGCFMLCRRAGKAVSHL